MKIILLSILLLLPLQIGYSSKGYVIPHQIVEQHINRTEYEKFKQKLGHLESTNRYYITSRSGYMGRYQFGPNALQDINITEGKGRFLSSINLQERALFEYLKKNEGYLASEIDSFVGKEINGIKITKSGLLAGAHLVGYFNVKRYLYSNGTFIPTDGNGVTVEEYLIKLGGYNFELNESLYG